MRTLMGAPPPCHARLGPRSQRLLRGKGIGQVGLEHDSGFVLQKFRFIQHPLKGGHRQVEIAILLHIQVNKFGNSGAVGKSVAGLHRRPVEGAQPFTDGRDIVVKGHQIDLAKDRGNLHRNVLNVGAGQQIQIRLQAPGGFAFA